MFLFKIFVPTGCNSTGCHYLLYFTKLKVLSICLFTFNLIIVCEGTHMYTYAMACGRRPEDYFPWAFFLFSLWLLENELKFSGFCGKCFSPLSPKVLKRSLVRVDDDEFPFHICFVALVFEKKKKDTPERGEIANFVALYFTIIKLGNIFLQMLSSCRSTAIIYCIWLTGGFHFYYWWYIFTWTKLELFKDVANDFWNMHWRASIIKMST